MSLEPNLFVNFEKKIITDGIFFFETSISIFTNVTNNGSVRVELEFLPHGNNSLYVLNPKLATKWNFFNEVDFSISETRGW